VARSGLLKRLGENVEEGKPREYHFHIVSVNNFPTAAGLASSASGFACLSTPLHPTPPSPQPPMPNSHLVSCARVSCRVCVVRVTCGSLHARYSAGGGGRPVGHRSPWLGQVLHNPS
jgi:hypothetical protein